MIHSVEREASPIERAQPIHLPVRYSVDEIVAHATKVSSSLSRTCNGISDTSVSSLKKKLLVEGDPLATRARTNFSDTLNELLNGTPRFLSSVEDTREFLIGIQKKLNSGLADPAVSIWRSWEIPILGTVAVADVQPQLDLFAKNFRYLWNDAADSSYALAAWVEHEIGQRICPWADGCGRNSRMLSAALLGRAGYLYPSFESTGQYHEIRRQSLLQFEREFSGLGMAL